jgi:outer membrane protein
MKMKITIILLCISLLPLSWQVQAQINEGPISEGPRAFSLSEAQAYAVQNNLNVQNARLDVDASRKLIWENTAMGLPQISASAGYNNNLKLATTLLPAEIFDPTAEPGTFLPVQFGTQHNATANVVANQLLFSGPYIVGLQAASKYKELSERSLIKSEADIKEAVAQSYYSILLAEAGKEAYEKNLESMKQRLVETKALYQTGFVEETDVDQISITVSRLENEYESSKKLADLSYRLLVYQMGYDLDADITISQTLEEIIEGLSIEILQSAFQVEDHIDFKIMNSQEQLAYLQVKRVQFEYLPTISANLNHMQMAMRQEFSFFDFDESWYPSTMLGFNLSVPVFSSGGRRAKIGQTKVELEKAKNLKASIASGLELGVTQAKINFSSAYEKYLNEQSNIELAQKVFDRTSVKFQSGMVSSLELTMASDQLTGIQTGYIAAMVEMLTAKLNLEKALGKL